MKIPLCNNTGLRCVKYVNEKFTPDCLKNCKGLVISSYLKTKKNHDFTKIQTNEYNNYKIQTPIDDETLKGIKCYSYSVKDILSLFIGFEWRNKLKVVRIYFDTPTFDLITQDRAAQLVDKLSAIGGTMGLLTGFSFISAVEVVYFGVKMILAMKAKKVTKDCKIRRDQIITVENNETIINNRY